MTANATVVERLVGWLKGQRKYRFEFDYGRARCDGSCTVVGFRFFGDCASALQYEGSLVPPSLPV